MPLQTDLWMELRRISTYWPKPAATGNHAQSFGVVDASRAPGYNILRFRNLHWRRNMDRWRTTPLLCTPFPEFMEREMVQDSNNQKISAVADVVVGLSLLVPWEA